MNYKVRVKNEVESKEVQELFFELGCKPEDIDEYDYPQYLACYDDLTFSNYKIDSCIDSCKEITITQLKDLVVLKRNDKNDANYKCDSLHKYLGYLTSDGVEYFWNYIHHVWHLSEKTFKSEGLKPIEEKEMKMKEYLELQEDGGYKLVLRGSVCMESDIAVPHGMNFAWKDDGSLFFSKSVNGYRDGYEIAWQRSETEKVQGEQSQWDIQVGGDHYKSMKIQPAKFALENKLDYCQANAIKYICRHESKNGKQDLEKAKHYIDLLIEHYYGNS